LHNIESAQKQEEPPNLVTGESNENEGSEMLRSFEQKQKDAE